jgi:hypothetical protein
MHILAQKQNPLRQLDRLAPPPEPELVYTKFVEVPKGRYGEGVYPALLLFF